MSSLVSKGVHSSLKKLKKSQLSYIKAHSVSQHSWPTIKGRLLFSWKQQTHFLPRFGIKALIWDLQVLAAVLGRSRHIFAPSQLSSFCDQVPNISVISYQGTNHILEAYKLVVTMTNFQGPASRCASFTVQGVGDHLLHIWRRRRAIWTGKFIWAETE